MANTINYAQIFNSVLDQIFYVMPRTMWMENTMPGLVWNNGKQINIPKLSTPGLGNMNGYKAPSGDMVLDYETKELQYYRGRNLTLGRYDVEMTNFAATVGNALNVFLKKDVIPEMDKLRLSQAATAAYGAGFVSYYTPDAGTILAAILGDIAAVQDQIGEDEQLYINISTQVKNILMNSDKITKFIDSRDFSVRSFNVLMEALNGQYLIGTPSSYMKSAFNLIDGADSSTGGVVADPLAQGINWIVAARPAVDSIARPQITKVIDPDMNQEGEFWKIMFSIYHGCWAYDNKLNGLRVSVNSSALGQLTVTSTSDGSGVTTLTAKVNNAAYIVPAGYSLFYKAQASTAPTVAQGTALDSTWTQLANGSSVAATNGHKVTVVLAAAGSKLPLASGDATVVAG